MTRRATLIGGSLVTASVAIGGCDSLSTEPEGSGSESGTTEKKGPQAPMLADLVESGDLPPVEDRLPTNPLVIEPTAETGQYGGTWRSFIDGLAAVGYKFFVELGYDSLVRWTPDWSDVTPNLAESWEVEDDGAAYTFHLREGTKWSDGTDFTADDLVFSMEDFFGNEELYPVPPRLFRADEKLGTLEKIDDYTVRFVFAETHGMFIRRMATPEATPLLVPRHYMEKFHPTYNPDVEAEAEAEGFASWVEYFTAQNDRNVNPDRPTLNAWRLVTSIDDAGGRGVFERNPYYWKTDPDGSQLPYIDKVTYEILDNEVALVRTTSGELDLNAPPLTAGVTTVDNKPVLAQSREEGGYRFIDGLPASMNHGVIAFNFNHENPVLREIFRNRDFRIGLSHAIDRDEIISLVFQRQGEPWQAAPREESDYYDEELAKQYIEFDVDLANEFLDKSGVAEADASGKRMGPDGKPIKFRMDVVTNEPPQIAMMELIREYWAEVGVDVQLNTIDRTLFYDRKAGNQHDASIWTGDGGLFDADLDARWYFAYSGESNFAPLWQTWYNSGGTDGEEPPAIMRQQMDLYDQMRVTADEGDQHDLFEQVLQIAKEEFWVIGTVLPMGVYGTVREEFHNVPDLMPSGWNYPHPGPTRPEQYFITG